MNHGRLNNGRTYSNHKGYVWNFWGQSTKMIENIMRIA